MLSLKVRVYYNKLKTNHLEKSLILLKQLRVLSDNARTKRIEKGLTHEQLSDESGVNRGTIYQIESGKGNVTIKTLNDVAVALGVSVTDLLTSW